MLASVIAFAFGEVANGSTHRLVCDTHELQSDSLKGHTRQSFAHLIRVNLFASDYWCQFGVDKASEEELFLALGW